MLQILSENILLTLFIVIALGAVFGAIPFGPVRFGAAGALFVGLLVGAVIPPTDADLALFQDLGLGLFVYMVGLEAGETFFKEFRRQFGMMITAVIAILLAAAAALIAGGVLGVAREMTVGVFAGALTNTPSLALAQQLTGSDAPAVGYSIGYPTGVATAILVVFLVMGRNWRAAKDQVDPDDAILQIARIEVRQPMTVRELTALGGDQARVSTVRRGSSTFVLGGSGRLEVGDVVVVFAAKSILPEVIEAVGRRVPRRRLRERSVSLHRFTLSNRDLAGSTVGDLPLFDLHRSRITRIRRADDEFLAAPDVHLEIGDVVEVVHPNDSFDELTEYFGNSIRSVSEVDSVAAAGGLALGFAAALIVVPLPGGAAFALGASAGPLIVGMILGALRRTGPVTWQLPRSANFTLRKFGLMIFLSAVGVASGPAFASTAFSLEGLTAVGMAIIISVVGCSAFFLLSWLQGRSTARSSGGVSGMLGQPAVLQFALERSSDSRIMNGYATTFAVAILVKIAVIPLILAV